MLEAKWILADVAHPELVQDDYLMYQSKSVLARLKYGTMCVAKVSKWDEDGKLEWHTCCSSSFNLDSAVTHWMHLPNQPKGET
jgi:hypothetical protein